MPKGAIHTNPSVSSCVGRTAGLNKVCVVTRSSFFFSKKKKIAFFSGQTVRWNRCSSGRRKREKENRKKNQCIATIVHAKHGAHVRSGTKPQLPGTATWSDAIRHGRDRTFQSFQGHGVTEQIPRETDNTGDDRAHRSVETYTVRTHRTISERLRGK